MCHNLAPARSQNMLNAVSLLQKVSGLKSSQVYSKIRFIAKIGRESHNFALLSSCVVVHEAFVAPFDIQGLAFVHLNTPLDPHSMYSVFNNCLEVNLCLPRMELVLYISGRS